MKKEISPAMMGVILVVVLAVVIAVGYRVIAGPGYNKQTDGSDKAIENVKKGGTFYQPPADAPVPKAPGGGGGGMYNLNPPPK